MIRYRAGANLRWPMRHAVTACHVRELKAAGWRADAIADKLGIGQGSVYRIMRGRR
jgi:hypothetical protein